MYFTCRLVPALAILLALLDGSQAGMIFYHADAGNRSVSIEGHNQYTLGHATANPEHNDLANWLLFDLSPITELIVAAELRLYLPRGGYLSPDRSETIQLRDASTKRPLVRADLETGWIYGSQIITLADEGSYVRFELNPYAQSHMQAAAAGDGLFAIGGQNVTKDLSRPEIELIFAYSFPARQGTVQLEIETIPEPSGALFLVFGSGILCVRTVRKGG